MNLLALLKSNKPVRSVIWVILAMLLVPVSASVSLPLASVIVGATILLLPGSIVMALCGVRPASTPARIILALALSLGIVMAVGGAFSLIGPHVGIINPLGRVAQWGLWSVLLASGIAACWKKSCEPLVVVFEGVTPRQVLALLIAGVPVILAALGAAILNNKSGNTLATFSIIVAIVILLVGIVGGWSRKSNLPLATMMYSATLSILYATSLRGAHLFGWDIQQEYGIASITLRHGAWIIPSNHDPYASMLSLTALPSELHALAGISLLTFFRVIIPAMLALVPVGIYTMLTSTPRWIEEKNLDVRKGVAFGVATLLIIASQVFPVELPSITRQVMGLVLLVALLIVLFSRDVSVAKAALTGCALMGAESFTHYSTAYLMSGVLFIAWLAGQGIFWLQNRYSDTLPRTRSPKMAVGLGLVIATFAAAFIWNVGITRNDALSQPSGAVTNSGLALQAGSGTHVIPAIEYQSLLTAQIHTYDKWLVPFSGSPSINLSNAQAPTLNGLAPHLHGVMSLGGIIGHDLVILLEVLGVVWAGLVLLRRKRFVNVDMFALGVAGLALGAVMRFSGTVAVFYNPERAALVTAMLTAFPITLLINRISDLFSKTTLMVLVLLSGLLLIISSGLNAVVVGGSPPSSLSNLGENYERFVVSSSEFGTAGWMQSHLGQKSLVQTDRYGQLVLLSAPGAYNVFPEIVPSEIDHRAFIYISSTNLDDGRARGGLENGHDLSVYKSPIDFINSHFSVIYSTGETRVYH